MGHGRESGMFQIEEGTGGGTGDGVGEREQSEETFFINVLTLNLSIRSLLLSPSTQEEGLSFLNSHPSTHTLVLCLLHLPGVSSLPRSILGIYHHLIMLKSPPS